MKKLLLLSCFFFFACINNEEVKRIIIVDGKNYNSEYVTKEDSRVSDIWNSGTSFVLNNTSNNLILESVIYKPKLSLSNLATDATKLINMSTGAGYDIDGQLLHQTLQKKEAKGSYFLNDEINISPGVNAINVYVEYLFIAPPKVKMIDEEEVNWYLHR